MTETQPTPREALRLLSRIWPASHKGYVFLPWIPQAQARSKARKRSWQEDRAFAWPKDKEAIAEHLEEHWDDELYFTPMVFSKPYRRSEYGILGTRLYADLDEVDPATIEDFYKPTHAWETSPGRYAAVWCMSSAREQTTAPGHENHKLTYWLEADISGWDTTQLLRVPGSANNKAHYERGTRGKVLWWNQEIHGWKKFDDLPDVELPRLPEGQLDEQMLEGIDRLAVWGKVRLRVSGLIRDYMRMRTTDGYDRSDVAWQIERELADAGCTVPEIVVVMRDSIWNKFVGRQDELKRLIIEASKALAERPEEVLESRAIQRPDMVPFWEDREYLEAPEPEWLVEGLIPKGGCGFIAGIPKSMKSWLSLDLAICVSTGNQWLDSEVSTPANVLYIQEEDPASLVRWRHHIIASSKDEKYALLDAEDELRDSIAAYPANMYALVYKGFRANEDAWQAWLMETCTEYKIDLVILDTLTTISPGIDTSQPQIKSDVLDPLKDVARLTGSTICIVHHMRKAQAGSARAGQNMSGNQQIHAWADYGVYVTEKDDRTHKLSFDHETKYTATRSHRYLIDTLPESWNPVHLTTEDDIEHSKQSKRKETTARLKEQIPDADAVDPAGAELMLSRNVRLQRAAIKALIDTDPDIRVTSIARRTRLAMPTVEKYISHLAKDYPNIKDYLSAIDTM